VRRGFKAEAERLAKQVRKEIGKKPTDPIDVTELASHLGAEVRSAEELVDLSDLEELDELQPGAFSACTFSFDDRHVIVCSPLASLGRRHSDIAHELSHLLLEHEIKVIEKIGSATFHTCDPDEEQEANWLAGCLLLPRELLLSAARKGLTPDQIASKYEVSEQMAAFRLRSTGVQRQLGAARQRR
jgi:Zn-dependent peptidase ImmA (M78 family)